MLQFLCIWMPMQNIATHENTIKSDWIFVKAINTLMLKKIAIFYNLIGHHFAGIVLLILFKAISETKIGNNWLKFVD